MMKMMKMNRLEQELIDINNTLSTMDKREETVINDIQKQFCKERQSLEERKTIILEQLKGENELLKTVYEEE